MRRCGKSICHGDMSPLCKSARGVKLFGLLIPPVVTPLTKSIILLICRSGLSAVSLEDHLSTQSTFPLAMSSILATEVKKEVRTSGVISNQWTAIAD